MSIVIDPDAVFRHFYPENTPLRRLLLCHCTQVRDKALAILANPSRPPLELDPALVSAGAMLHDIGKLYEMGGLIATEYTTAGRLLGHIVIGSELIGKACDKIEGFPESTKIQLQHIIVSHHGKMEFGSPCLPQTPEAMALFRADEFDSHIYQAFRAIGEESEQPGDFTSRVKGLDTALYKTEAAKGGVYSMAFPEGGKVEEPVPEEPEVSDSAPTQDYLFK